jgi:hypothetical protein
MGLYLKNKKNKKTKMKGTNGEDAQWNPPLGYFSKHPNNDIFPYT